MDKPISSVRSDRIKRRIIKVSDAIRKKYKALTLGMKEQDAALSKLFTPVLSPLKEISTKIDDTYKHQQQPQKLGIVERDNEARELSTPSTSKRVKTYGRNQNQRVVEFSFLPPRSINQPLESSNNRAKNDEERETDDSVMMNDDEQLHRQQDDEETLDENFEKDVEEDEEVFEYKPEEEEMKTEYETASKLNLSDIKQPEVFED